MAENTPKPPPTDQGDNKFLYNTTVRDTRTGEVREVSPEEMKQGFGQGLFDLPTGTTVTLLDATGSAHEGLRPREAFQLLQTGNFELSAGWDDLSRSDEANLRERIESSALEMGLAGASRIVSGATLGLSDALTEQPHQAKRASREALGDSAGLLELAGGVGTALLGSGVVSLGSKAGQAGARAAAMTPAGLVTRAGIGIEQAATKAIGSSLRKTMLGRTIPTAAGAAFEGALFAGGDELRRQAIEEGGSIDGAKLGIAAIKGAGLGAATAGAMGVGGAFARGASKTARSMAGKVASKMPKGALESMADDATKRAFAFSKKELKDMAARGVDARTIDRARAIIRETGGSTVDIARRTDEVLAKHGARIGEILDAGTDAGATISKAQVQEAFDRATTKLVKTGGQGRQAHKAMVKARQDLLDNVFPAQGGDVIPVRALDPEIKGLQIGEGAYRADVETALRNLRGDVAYELRRIQEDSVGEALGRQFGDELKAARQEYAAHKTLSKAINDRAVKEGGGSFLGLRETLVATEAAGSTFVTMMQRAAAGGVTGGVVGGIPGAVAGAALNAIGGAVATRVLKTRGPQATARFLDAMARRQTARQMAGAVDDKVVQAVKRILSRDAVKHAPPLSATILATTSYSRDGKAGEGDKATAFANRAKELAALNADPTGFVEELTQRLQPFGEVAPEAIPAIVSQQQRKVAFLHMKAPKDPAPSAAINQAVRDWRPPDWEIAKFERYMAAAEDPLSVLDDLAAGIMTPEGPETLQMVYPELFAQVQQEFVEQGAELQENLPYSKRVQLSLLLDTPLDPSLQPGSIAALQQVATEAVAEEEAASQPARVNTAKAASAKFAEHSATPSQRIAT